MTSVLRSLPAMLAALLLAAHFLRAQSLVPMAIALALVPLVLVRHPAVRLASRLALLAATAEWALTAWQIARARAEAGRPYARLLVIVLGVAAFTAFAAWLLPRVPPAPASGPAAPADRDSR